MCLLESARGDLAGQDFLWTFFSGEESKACRRVVGSETSLSAHICSRGNDR